MTRLTPRIGINLQAAKKAAAERYFAIAMKYLPEGYRVEYRKSLSGLCYGGDIKLVKAPRPVTRKSLYIFLHECVHAVLGHYNSGKPRHVEEMEAEKWTHKTMRENGVPVPRKMTKRAKAYVRRKIKQAQRRGAKSIDKQAVKFAGMEQKSKTQKSKTLSAEEFLEREERKLREIDKMIDSGNTWLARKWLNKLL